MNHLYATRNLRYLHQQRHPEPVDGCYACKIATVNVAAEAVPTRRAGVVDINTKDRALAKDRDAYLRLRRDGLQPDRIDGSAMLEQSNISDQWDINLGRVVPRGEQSRIQEGLGMAKELGLGN